MENNILSKEEILKLINLYKDNFTQIFLSKKHSDLYKLTVDFIQSNYIGNKFTEKVYKHIYGEKYCKQCNILLTSKKFRSFTDGYCEEFCSKKCAYKHPQRINNIKKTNLKKYGCENVFQNKEIQNRFRKTMLKNHGVEHNWSKNSPLREQCYITNEKLHGSRYWNNTEKIKKTKYENNSYLKQKESLKTTCNKKYGVDFYVQTEEFKNKFRNHFLITYGVTHPAHVPKFHERHQYRWKNYVLPSGKVIKIQGYEHLALNILLKKYKENDIVVDRKFIPIFWYYTSDGKKHRYYPDIFIKSSKLILEIKSTWTNSINCEIDKLKKESVIKNGYEFQKLIFDRKGNLLNE